MTTITLSGKLSDRFPTYCLAAVRESLTNQASCPATMVECCLDDAKDYESKRSILRRSGYVCATPVMVIHGHNDAIMVDYVSESGEQGWFNRNEILFGRAFIEAAKRINAEMLAEDTCGCDERMIVACPECGHKLCVQHGKCID